MGKTTTELEIKVSGGQVTNASVIEDENPHDAFILVEASKLSTDDEFLKYKPKTKEEEHFKKQLIEIIEKGVKDFWHPKYDPSFSQDEKKICYVSGKKPAIGKPYNWWNKVANNFCPERHSRIGTKSEYVAFLGILIKKLVESGWKMENAWRAVCCDSKELGHYWNSKNAKRARAFEYTGSREICGFFDLANTYKILAKDEETGRFWLAGGSCECFSNYNPLANFQYGWLDTERFSGTGWIVFD